MSNIVNNPKPNVAMVRNRPIILLSLSFVFKKGGCVSVPTQRRRATAFFVNALGDTIWDAIVAENVANAKERWATRVDEVDDEDSDDDEVDDDEADSTRMAPIAAATSDAIATFMMHPMGSTRRPKHRF